jgi:hypothetical protein
LDSRLKIERLKTDKLKIEKVKNECEADASGMNQETTLKHGNKTEQMYGKILTCPPIDYGKVFSQHAARV